MHGWCDDEHMQDFRKSWENTTARNTLTNGPHYHSHTTSISLPLYYFVNKAILVSAKTEEILTVWACFIYLSSYHFFFSFLTCDKYEYITVASAVQKKVLTHLSHNMRFNLIAEESTICHSDSVWYKAYDILHHFCLEKKPHSKKKEGKSPNVKESR